VDKVRYNPGHLYHHEKDKPVRDKVRFLADVAREHDCAIRVGVNCGSVDPEIKARHPEDDVAAMVDGPRLRQVVANVVKNAVEATERTAGATIDVRLGRRGSAVIIEVTDNGPGVPADAREKIFLPFFTTKPHGTGLGLAIVKKIMDLHGGEIELESAAGRGTTVRLIIPRGGPPSAALAGTGGTHEAAHSHR